MKRKFVFGAAAFLFISALLLLQVGPAEAQPSSPFVVSHLRSLGVSPPVSQLPAAHFARVPHEIPLRIPPAVGPGPQKPSSGSGGVQTIPGPTLPSTEGPKIKGIGYNGTWPPDPNIAVGKTYTPAGTTEKKGYIVQVVNTEIAVFDKSEVLKGIVGLDGIPGLLQEKNLSDLWAGTACAVNDGDPIVQYDEAANRWLITQIGSLAGPYSECLALSTTGDPTGSYYLWQDSHFGSYLNDYPKFGVWPTETTSGSPSPNSAYLATYNLFVPLGLSYAFAGAQLCAYDRSEMLNGKSVTIICTSPGVIANPSYLPSDLDGPRPTGWSPPGYFLDFDSTSSLSLYEIQPDFADGTALLTQEPDISVPPFNEACNGGNCIPQPGTSQLLASLGDRLMYRLAYRVVNGHAWMVVDHSVAVGNKHHGSVGISWYELRASTVSDPFSLYQQGTFAPDSADRWMGSVAMDGLGDIALGYSKSSGSIYPEIDFAGRTPSMPLGTLSGETQLQAGYGSQLGTNRWGDYTALRIDPDNDTTFWYTDEYYNSSSDHQWSTFIGSFTIAGSSGGSGSGSGSGSGGNGVDFALSVSPATQTLCRSNSTSCSNSSQFSVSVSSTSGLSSPVQLGVSGLPSKTTATFVPNPVGSSGDKSDTDTLTITVGQHGSTGQFGVSITGTDSSGSASAPLTLTVNK